MPADEQPATSAPASTETAAELTPSAPAPPEAAAAPSPEQEDVAPTPEAAAVAQCAAATEAPANTPAATEGTGAAQTTETTADAPAVPENWGSIKDVLNGPLDEVPGGASWCAVLCMWFLLVPNLVQGIIGGLCPRVFVCFSIGTCCIPGSQSFCSLIGAVNRGRPLYMAWVFMRGILMTLVALIANGKSRLGLFLWEWKAFGGAEYWWHGEGVWVGSYENCNRILQGVQHRHPAFGAVKAPTPDLYPSKLLIFLPNLGPDCEWAAMRKALHQFFLFQGVSYATRVQRLPELLAQDWQEPTLKDLKKVPLLQQSVAKCMFFMMFEVWVTDKEAKILANWRNYAEYFILPRMMHRFVFNVGIGKVKALRTQTVGLVEKYEKQGLFARMNESLGEFKRSTVVQLCDEVMFAIGFAGIGGTCAATESVAAFLRAKLPKESAGRKYIHWGQYDTSEKMVEKYKENPERYIRETCRLDPPVTSATSALAEETQVTLAGKEFTFPQGTLNQYALSIANRDPVLFPNDKVFNPDRENLEKALTWNGAFGADNEDSYPRICPGRYLSLDLTKTIINHALGVGVTTEVTV